MTLAKSAWAIDGAMVTSELARTATFVGAPGVSGILESGDLKVTQLSTPGVGIQIAAGAGVALNRYQGSKPNQSYVITNPSPHVISPAQMPPVSTSSKIYFVGVAIGDPQYSQVGHPFMPTSIPAGTEATFEYVRPFILDIATIPWTSGTQPFPMIPLALLTVPPNTTTITNAMIGDLRTIASPRTRLEMNLVPETATAFLSPSTTLSYVKFLTPTVLSTVVPTWATKGYISGWVEGVRLEKQGGGNLTFRISNGTATAFATATTVIEANPSIAKERRTYNLGGVLDLTPFRGTAISVEVWGSAGSTASQSFLSVDASASAMAQLQMVEAPN